MDVNYTLQHIIGSGSFGYVFLAIDQNNKKYAIKRIIKVGKQLSREVEILQEIKNCKFCVKMIECFYTETENKFIQNIVFEYLELDLYKLINTQKSLSQRIPIQKIKSLSYQIFSGLAWIHKKNLVHRDLKPENLLLNKNNEIKICDFGSSKFLDEDGKNSPYVVSQYYRAPELFFCMTNYTSKIDIWAAGCILAEMVILKPLFMGNNDGDQIFCIMKILGSPGFNDKNYLIEHAPFIKPILEAIPDFERDREVIEGWGGFLEGQEDRESFLDLVERIFVFNPCKRLSAEEVLKHEFFDSVRAEFEDG